MKGKDIGAWQYSDAGLCEKAMITDLLTIEEIAHCFGRKPQTIKNYLSVFYDSTFFECDKVLPEEILMTFLFAEQDGITKDDVVEFSRYAVRYEKGMTEWSDDNNDNSVFINETTVILDDKAEYQSQDYFDYYWSDDYDNEDNGEYGQIEQYDGQNWTIHEVLFQNHGEYHIRDQKLYH